MPTSWSLGWGATIKQEQDSRSISDYSLDTNRAMNKKDQQMVKASGDFKSGGQELRNRRQEANNCVLTAGDAAAGHEAHDVRRPHQPPSAATSSHDARFIKGVPIITHDATCACISGGFP